MLGPRPCGGPGSGVQLTEVCPAHRGAFLLLRMGLSSFVVLGVFSSFLSWWGPETAVGQPSPAPRSRISEEASRALMREHQSRWQETEVIPVAVVQTA